MKKFLLVFLMLLPFQWLVSRTLSTAKLGSAATLVQLLDELFIIFSILPLVCIRLLKITSLTKSERVILLPLICVFYWDIVSGLKNANPILLTLSGSFFHIKNFLIIFLFSSLDWKSYEIRAAYRALLIMAIGLATVAIIQEIIVLTSQLFTHYPLIFWPSLHHEWRWLFYRCPSLVGHPNILAIFLLLFFAIELPRTKNNFKLLFLFLGICCTISRMSYIALTIISLPFLKRRKWLIPLLSAPITFILLTSSPTLRELGLFGKKQGVIKSKWITTGQYRGYVLKKSLEIWKDQPIFGVGPGMYGDVVSFVFKSPIYKKYRFHPYVFEYAKKERNLDQFYPIIMAESGFPCLLLFVILLISLFISPWIIAKTIGSSFVQAIARGLCYVPPVLATLLLVNTINMAFFLLPYFALLGMVISYSRNTKT